MGDINKGVANTLCPQKNINKNSILEENAMYMKPIRIATIYRGLFINQNLLIFSLVGTLD